MDHIVKLWWTNWNKKCEDWKRSKTRRLFVTDSIQHVQWYITKETLEGFGDFTVGRQVIHTVKYADDLVLLAKEEMVL